MLRHGNNQQIAHFRVTPRESKFLSACAMCFVPEMKRELRGFEMEGHVA